MSNAFTRIMLLTITLLIIGSTAFCADNVTISGKITFTCDWGQSYMESNFGHKYIKTVPNGKYVTALYGVATDVIIKNSKSDIIGLAKTQKDGTFTASVEPSNFYTVSFDFLNKQHTKTISKDSPLFLDFDFGHLDGKIFDKISQ